ncbi:MAG: hypothetical protein GXZ10_13285 [Gammaproteobacteria bacterium]|nr:hypothetical protein [Gammaproteobacteria bacterium]
MIHDNQFEYDNAEPDFSDYQDEPAFAKFAEHVTLELLRGRECQGIDGLMLLIDLELAGGGYQLALEWVCGRVTEDQYRAWLDD